MAAMELTRTHRILIGVVVAGAVIIAAIGFAGSYAAVRELAEQKGFGRFSLFFPIGIDAGICVLLALDLLLTWIRIPFPLLRQTAWLLTAATIAFNGAAAWPDPLGVGMHAVIPVLFVVCVEAARHAVGRIADITADKHMEGVRLTRWLLSPIPTFKLWRRMKLWELRSYEQVIRLEQDRLIYQARLQARFGRSWRRKAPIESLMPLRLARFGVPLSETGPAGLAAAGIEPALLPPAPVPAQAQARPALAEPATTPALPSATADERPQEQAQEAEAAPELPDADGPSGHESPWFAAPAAAQAAYDNGYNPQYVEGLEPTPVMVPAGPGRTRPLGGYEAQPEQPATQPAQYEQPDQYAQPEQPEYPQADPDALPPEEEYYLAFRKFIGENGLTPSARTLGAYLHDLGYNHTLLDSELSRYAKRFEVRYQQELDAEHIA
ncbi:DUF2637 domain-containing protein [Streptomyces sp. A3M-1-3]|uniref:DUF2637 domain-containing protein n=1 Tax=Streptomyces sp. A3M-1-3 TaxID=2962044 RepID=UPI0020B70F0B|nr:DUF2637 domain-containing protein [Streptomyces sp. A3M-1-3]MCP3822117.1 DUF2637 domain-containing protein [Streptomyces sp. A3M-1-3]